jgi:hypothetical protein
MHQRSAGHTTRRAFSFLVLRHHVQFIARHPNQMMRMTTRNLISSIGSAIRDFEIERVFRLLSAVTE